MIKSDPPEFKSGSDSLHPFSSLPGLQQFPPLTRHNQQMRRTSVFPEPTLSSVLDKTAQEDALARGFTRRQLGRIAGVLAAGASLPFYNEFAMAQRGMPSDRPAFPPDAVRINSNENPLGPCQEAIEAMAGIAKFGGRYSPHGEQGDFIKLAADIEGLKPEYVEPYAGSSDPLHRTICGFCSPTRSFVMGDPGYNAGAGTAQTIGARVYKIPLRKDHSHDVEAMVKADPSAGVLYICNPNNPTGTMTSREDIDYLLANKPKGSILLLDQAYIHFSNVPLMADLVSSDKDVIILRTFSKLYGMAGIRYGIAIGRPDMLAKLRPWGSGMPSIMGVAAAIGSLKAPGLIEKRKKINRDIRENVFEFLQAKGFSFIPSDSNKFMLEVNRPGEQIVKALADDHVYIGRVWPIWPTKVRVSIGTQSEMDRFKKSLMKAMAA
jgi:histidinol-phosphate aminotransferase